MRAALSLLLFALSSLSTYAQSFDCKLAQTPREHAVCADTKLSALDTAIAAAYKSLRAQLSPESAALVQSDQREWLRWLDLVCPAHGKGIVDDIQNCLENHYNDRKDSLALEHTNALSIYDRVHYLYAAAAPQESPDGENNPGFGYGSLQYPQIDIPPSRPNPAYAAWNNAVKTRAAKLAVGFTENKNATFDTAVNASGTIESYVTIEADNDRFIDVTLTDSTYGWGAAHPLTDRTSFLWWLDRNRELTVNDVFLPNSGWQQHLVPLVIARLHADPDLQIMLWKGDELQKAVESGIISPASWTITRDGLTITFGQYAVAAYAGGMPEVHFTWDELRPFLEPTLQPSTLPAPNPSANP